MRPESGDSARLWDMLQSARQAQEYVRGYTWERYIADALIRDATERRIEIIGEAARGVSREFRDAHPEIAWKGIMAQRHVLAHKYEVIDHQRIWTILTIHLPELIGQLEPLVPRPPQEELDAQ